MNAQAALVVQVLRLLLTVRLWTSGLISLFFVSCSI